MQIIQSGIIYILDVNNLFTEKKFQVLSTHCQKQMIKRNIDILLRHSYR